MKKLLFLGGVQGKLSKGAAFVHPVSGHLRGGRAVVVDMDRAGMLLGMDVIALAGFHKETNCISATLGGASPYFDVIHEGKF